MSATWEVRPVDRDPNAWDVYDSRGAKIAHLPWCSLANARLIAAAPEMLEALREAIDILADQDVTDCGLRRGLLGVGKKWLEAVTKAESGSVLKEV